MIVIYNTGTYLTFSIEKLQKVLGYLESSYNKRIGTEIMIYLKGKLCC